MLEISLEDYMKVDDVLKAAKIKTPHFFKPNTFVVSPQLQLIHQTTGIKLSVNMVDIGKHLVYSSVHDKWFNVNDYVFQSQMNSESEPPDAA